MNARYLNFSNVRWHGLLDGAKDPLHNELEAFPPRYRASRHELLARTCRELYTNYEEKRDYRLAGEFHYWSMEALRKKGLKELGLIGSSYWILSGYGERPRRASVVLGVIWLVFAAFYFLVVSSSPFWVFSACDVYEGIKYAGQALAYSLSALVRLNPRPQTEHLDWFQTLVTIEGILGPLQIALLALAIRRKVMR